MSTQHFERVRAFLRDHVEAYEHLEVLLLVCRHGDRPWTPAEIAGVLNLPVAIVSDALTHLRTRRLMERLPGVADSFSYRPESSENAECVAALRQVYETDRLSIIEAMSTNALERLRTSTIRAFADAFRLRGGRDDG